MSNSHNLSIITRHVTKASKSVRTYSDTIPTDLLIDIFSRVPAKSIARLRCVSKFWASILARSYFTELYLTMSWNRPRILFISEVGGQLLFFSSPQPPNPYENCSLVATRYKFSKCLTNGMFQHHYGLIFYQSRIREDRVICNPLTGKSITLPKINIKQDLVRSFLCYDEINKQFKVLCYQLPQNTHLVNTHWVLTLESGNSSCWRTIESEPYSPYNDISSGICIDGVLYYTVDYSRSVVVCFNVRSEKFSFININAIDMFKHNLSWILTNYKGKLGAYLCCTRRSNKEFVLWVLEDTEKHIWSKNVLVLPLCEKTINGNMFHYMVSSVTRTGEIVFSSRSDHAFYVYYYNFERNTFTKMEIQGLPEVIRNRRIDMFPDYVENMNLM